MILYFFLALAALWLFAAYSVLSRTDARQLPGKAAPVLRPRPDLTVDVRTTEPIDRSVTKVDPSNDSRDCIWPPVTADGEFPCGHEMLPILDIKVPKFWTPPNEEFASWRSYMSGEETIFIMIASYRDFQCRETIASALSRATHPDRIFIGAVDQVVPGDTGCLDLEVPCSQDPSQIVCQHLDQISVFKMDAAEATGPVTARHIGDRMYRGQHFAMQLDAHCQFVRDWDTRLIGQWKSTGNEMAVLTSYLSDVQGAITPAGDAKPKTRPIMCNSDFEGAFPARYLRHGAQPEDLPAIQGTPQLEPYWAAGFSFSRGHFRVRVPYDAYQPMVFQGEEIALGVRGFTFGYDFYAPVASVIFHEYAVKSKRRQKVHMFWENNKHAGEGVKSLRRATSVVGLATDIDPATWNHAELDKYGLGTVRNVSQFYKLFLVDTKERKATQICPFVKSGIMHRDFTAFLRPDGMGIDYSRLQDYDTRTKLEQYLLTQQPVWRQHITDALKRKDIEGANFGLEMAGRVGLAAKDPAFIADARQQVEVLFAERQRQRKQAPA